MFCDLISGEEVKAGASTCVTPSMCPGPAEPRGARGILSRPAGSFQRGAAHSLPCSLVLRLRAVVPISGGQEDRLFPYLERGLAVPSPPQSWHHLLFLVKPERNSVVWMGISLF